MPSEPVSNLRGVGPTLAKRLQKLNIRTKLDLILHLPYRYQDRTRVTPFSQLTSGSEHYVQGRILGIEKFGGPRPSVYVAIGEADSKSLNMRLLHYSPRQVGQLSEGMWLRLYGVVRLGRKGLEMVHPEYRTFHSDPGAPPQEFVPVYRKTQGVSSARLGSLIRQALDEVAYLPNFRHQGFTLGESIRLLHEPDPKRGLEGLNTARKRVAFDELLAFTLLQSRRHVQQRTYTTFPLDQSANLKDQFLSSLGFSLTTAQERVVQEILDDLAKSNPMLRLVQGDVGSGKTVVAALAIVRAAENNMQTAFMAPTEILAEQHHETLSRWLTPLGIQVGLLTGRMAAPVRRTRQEAIARGEDMVAVGTHALFQTTTRFKSLGLAIIDEQHRFGVHQRMLLRDKGRLPHQLIMTATPIPRTLAMYLFADMDVSTIDEMPPGRQPIETTIHSAKRRDQVIAAVRRFLESGQQVFWVCVAIDQRDPEDGDFRGTQDVLQELGQRLPGVRIAHLHGRMKTDEKHRTMEKFRRGEIQLLVATTVVEVGIDVSNATLMVIDDADRFGMAQLHQLRGRVGRGAEKSYCMMIFDPPISENSRHRLNALRQCTDGFELARQDLEIRGPGEVFGTAQSGVENFRVANLAVDSNLLQEARQRARELINSNPDLASSIIDTWTPSTSDYAAV
ncbi:MAG: ATP-dependent DNA helicase RecG [Gammaproteobacteria bacterium]|nr:ATP-dependent DNA helicase RecG [Gammaproteobacteria bacterium]